MNDKIHEGILTVLCYNKDYLFTADSSGELKQWNLDNFLLKRDFINQKSVTRGMCCTDDGKFLFTTNSEGDVYQYDVSEGFCLSRTYEKCHKTLISAMICTPDSKF